MNELLFGSASEIARRIRDREISAVEATDMHLAQLDAVNPALNAVVTRCDDLALRRAKELDTALANGESVGPLHGVPVTIKDAFDTAGVRTTGGTKGRANYLPSTNATAVERLLEAGAILIGKTNTPELTLFYDTDNRLFGKTCNPYDLSRSPGGSSGGATAIVAAGGAALDLGSDTGGSIRLPAHYCGVAGIKPTAGRVPRTGLIVPGGVPVDSLTQVGPIARYVEDLALVLPIVSGPDWRDTSAVPMEPASPAAVRIADLKVAFYTDNGEVAASPDVAAVVEDCARVMAGCGAAVVEARPPGIEQTRSLFKRIFNADGGAWIRRILKSVGTTEVSPSLAWATRSDGASDSTANAVTLLGSELNRFRQRMLGFMRHHDVILAPVHAGTALPHAELTGDENSPGFSYAQTYNLTGWPAVTVRAGTNPEGLPVGIQVVARPWREDVALAVARQIEKSLGGWGRPALANYAPEVLAHV